MRHYETLFILHPNLNEEEYKDVLRKFGNLVERFKGVLVKIDEWGNQRLAYQVKKCDRGYYVLLDYCGEPGLVPELERDLRLDDRVLQFQSVKVADHADPNELILKAKEGKKEEATDEPPPEAEEQAHDQGSGGEAAGEVKSDV